MKNGFLKKAYSAAAVIFLIFTLCLFGCGGSGGSGGSDKSASSKASSKGKSKKPVQSFIAHVDVSNGTMVFEYPKDKGNGKRASKLQITPSLTIATVGPNTWHPVEKVFKAQASLTNNTSDPLYGTYVAISSILPSGAASVRNENGYDPNGNPYFDYAPDGEKIAPSVSGSAVIWEFSDPDAKNFSFTGDIYADNWRQIAGDGINGVGGSASTQAWDAHADMVDSNFAPAMIGFNGKLYILIGKTAHPARDTGSNNDLKIQTGGAAASTYPTGAEVWEYDPTTGNFAQVNADGFGGSEDYLNKSYNNWGGVFAEFNGSLYAGTGKAIFGNGLGMPATPLGGEIWKYSGSGTTWTKMHSFSDAKGISVLQSFDGSLFAGSQMRGYGGMGKTSSRLDYSSDGTTWNIIMTNSFGDTSPTNTFGYGSTMNSSANISFNGTDTYSFIQKSGITEKPGVTLFRAGPSGTGNKGRVSSDWNQITDNVADDIYATITGVTRDNTPGGGGAGGGRWLLTVSFAATPADHALAHHHAWNITQGRSSIHILDNVDSQIAMGIAAADHTPAVSDQLRLTSGANERGYSETSNATSGQLTTFAPSNEFPASPSPNSLWAFTSNLPQGVPQYNPSGGNIYSTSTGGSADSDWVRRMDFFSYLDYPTPGASGGAQFGGNVESPISVNSGFGNRSEFTYFAGSHEGWLYCSVMPFQRDDTGFRLYKTADGVNWIKITNNGFGDNEGSPRAFVSLGGKLYMSKGRPGMSNSISSSGTSPVGITAATTVFYEVATAFPTPSIFFPTSGTLALERTTTLTEPIAESAFVLEKVNYTGTRVASGNTLAAALPLNHGTLARHLWALDSQIIASGLNTTVTANSDFLPASGAILVEGEVIQYSSISGSTISVATRAQGTYPSPLYERGTRGPADHGSANHAKGTPIYRTTKHLANDYFIVLSGSTNLDLTGTGRAIIIDNEKISYAGIAVTTRLTTPLREKDGTTPAAHTVSTSIDKGAWTGITRGLHGTTATTWASGETITPVSFGSAELWVTE